MAIGSRSTGSLDENLKWGRWKGAGEGFGEVSRKQGTTFIWIGTVRANTF